MFENLNNICVPYVPFCGPFFLVTNPKACGVYLIERRNPLI